jgi:hypothetical protein
MTKYYEQRDKKKFVAAENQIYIYIFVNLSDCTNLKGTIFLSVTPGSLL